jgi:hypothetical protein
MYRINVWEVKRYSLGVVAIQEVNLRHEDTRKKGNCAFYHAKTHTTVPL